MEKEFEENFEKLYENIYENCSERLKNIETKKNKIILGVVIICIIINLIKIIFFKENGISEYLILFFSIAIILIVVIIGKQRYRKLYKACVIEGLVKGYSKNLDFSSQIGITKMDYVASKFDKNFDSYYSEDKIYGNLETGEKIQMAEVVTKEVQIYTDANNETHETETLLFRGLYGTVSLMNNINSNIYVASNSNFNRFSKERVEIDSSEFEKYYDCFCDDKIKTMQIFTADLIEKYVDIIRNKKYGFELKIVNNMIYFRYKCDNAFEPPTFKTGLDKEFVRKYYKLIYYPLEIVKSTIANIKEI